MWIVKCKCILGWLYPPVACPLTHHVTSKLLGPGVSIRDVDFLAWPSASAVSSFPLLNRGGGRGGLIVRTPHIIWKLMPNIMSQKVFLFHSGPFFSIWTRSRTDLVQIMMLSNGCYVCKLFLCKLYGQAG